jgi:hypothetical protein
MPCVFESSEKNNSVFAMDWYYPAMCSVVSGSEATGRLFRSWNKFVVHGLGSLCNLEQNWVTAAETSELAIALAVHCEYERASGVLSWLHHMRDDDGAYWYGVALPQREIWPAEKPSWTSAAVVLAADMLNPTSATNLVLDHPNSLCTI